MRASATTDRSRERAGSAGTGGVANWLRSIRVSWFTVLMLMIIVLFVVIIAPGLRVYVEQRQQIADLRAQVAASEAQNAALEAQVARWSDPAYVRAQARDRLYYVMPGETSLLVLNDVPAPAVTAGQAPVSTVAEPAPVDWLSTLFASAMTSALTQSTPEQLEQTGQVEPAPAVEGQENPAP